MKNKLKTSNGVDIRNIKDKSFSQYGSIIESMGIEHLISYMLEKTCIPLDGNIYVPSEKNMENIIESREIEKIIFGGQKIQVGYCNGKNDRLNALEYHKSSEVNIAVTDMILILGDIRDIKEGVYDTEKTDIFYVPKGTIIELYATTLHFSPCKVSEEGFKCIVILPSLTNTEIDRENYSDTYLFKNNKWILTHKDNKKLSNENIKGRLIGENIKIYHT